MSDLPQDSPASTPANDSTQTVAELRRVVQLFVDERNWRQYHNAKNLTMALSVEAGELMEHFQWLTTENVEQKNGFDKAAVSEELSDVICYALALANTLDIDLTAAIENKMIKNRQKYPAAQSEQPASIEKPPKN